MDYQNKRNDAGEMNAQLSMLAQDLEFISGRLAKLKRDSNCGKVESLEAAFNNTISAFCFIKDLEDPK